MLTSIDGVEFDDAWQGRRAATVEGMTIPVIGRDHLIRNKKATGRPKDLVDLRWLETHATEAGED